MKQIIKITIGLLLASSVSVFAQEEDFDQRNERDQRRHEFGIHAAGGLSTLQYDLRAGKRENGFGGQVGLNYAYFFLPNWGVGTGAEIALYQAKTKLSNFSDRYDVQGAVVADNYTYTFTINEYSEALRAFYFNIPLMLQYQTDGKHKIFAAIGGKFGIPVKATAKTNDYSVSTKGFFPAEGRTYDDLPQFGFGTYDYAVSSRDVAYNVSIMASAEMGMKWQIREKYALYTGIYVDYGLNNIQKANDKTFVKSALSAENPNMSPLVSSQFAGKPFTDKISPLAVGLKVKFVLGAGKDVKKADSEDDEQTTEEKAAAKREKAAAKEEKAAAKREKKIAAKEEKIVIEEVVETRNVNKRQSKRKKTEEKVLVEVTDAADVTTEEVYRRAYEEAYLRFSEERAAREEAEAAARLRAANPEMDLILLLGSRQVAVRGHAINIIRQPIGSYALMGTELTNAQRQQLDVKIDLMLQFPDLDVFIYGHTCDLGGPEINEIIGLQRARNARAYMLSRSISEDRIIGIASKRDTQPLVPNTSEENRLTNRRIEIVVQ